MERYLAIRIYNGKLDYIDVCKKYPQYKKEIDKILKELQDEEENSSELNNN